MHARALASWTVAVTFGTLAGCSAADSSHSPVTSPPPAPSSSTSANPSGSTPNDEDSRGDGGLPDDGRPTPDASTGDTFDAGPDAQSLVSCEGSGWVAPSGANCNSSSSNDSCSTTCMGGSKFWEARCQDGVCTCSVSLATMCQCRMVPGTCKSCCPGMP